jgi:hypothetical protein
MMFVAAFVAPAVVNVPPLGSGAKLSATLSTGNPDWPVNAGDPDA